MKSIRRTVLFNVILLMLVTLAAVSLFVYRTTHRSIVEKQETARQLVQVQFDDKRDEAMLNQAYGFAREAQSQFNTTKFYFQPMEAELAALTAALTPSGFAPLTVLAAEFTPSPLAFDLRPRIATELKLNEDDMYRESDSPGHMFVQINGAWGVAWQSKSLAGHSLPLDAAAFESAALYHVQFDNIVLPDGREARRVVMKAPVTKYNRIGTVWLPPPLPPRDAEGKESARGPRRLGPVGPPAPPRPGDNRGFRLPTIFIQCAWDMSDENPRLSEHALKRDAQIVDLEEETRLTLAGLRATLAWTATAAIAIALVGGWFLVGLGLSPLKRLSQAVSEISTKDFRVPIEPASLPTELTPVVERLSLALGQLQRAFEREKRAAADISHELRTPLAALTTTLEVALRKSRSSDDYRKTLDECRVIARQMSQMVERLLMLAWLDAGADAVRPESVEVGELVRGCAAVSKPLAEVQGLQLHVRLPVGLTVRTDPDKFREVVMNLLHNAIEYNRPGGEVELTASSDAAGGVIVEVRDTGIGMPPEIHEKIFERFFRGDPARHAAGTHAGLGLSLVKEYVDRLGGRLTVDSVVGRGSRFRVELPNAS